ncbi:MAG TPA: hypothetical protein VNG51_23810 [Ktedonobacteraceae bacterium]|nr:hypothetical protein [Ktedonobacteraceae bacterium]
MAKAVKDAVIEEIEAVDQLDENTSKKGRKLWFLAVPALVILATGAFLWVRRSFGAVEE